MLIDKQLMEKIIGAAIAVHCQLGHFAVVRLYLKAANVQSGLILNFAFMPLAIKRVGREEANREVSFS